MATYTNHEKVHPDFEIRIVRWNGSTRMYLHDLSTGKDVPGSEHDTGSAFLYTKQEAIDLSGAHDVSVFKYDRLQVVEDDY